MAIALRDIRAYIPRTKQTDPNEFPPVPYQRYPLMPLDVAGKPIIDDRGNPVTLLGPDEEEAFHAENPEVPRVLDPEDRANELQSLRDELARMKAAKAPEAEEPATVSSLAKPNAEKPKLTLGKKLD